MGNSKSSRMTGAEIGLTPHEEKLLQGYFRRRTRPYLAALLALGCVLGGVLSVGMPGPASDPQADAERLASELESATAAIRAEFDAELGTLRAELESLSAAMPDENAAPRALTDTGARKRLDQLDGAMRRVTQRLDEVEARAKSAESQLLGLEDRGPVPDGLVAPAPAAEEEAGVSHFPFE